MSNKRKIDFSDEEDFIEMTDEESEIETETEEEERLTPARTNASFKGFYRRLLRARESVFDRQTGKAAAWIMNFLLKHEGKITGLIQKTEDIIPCDGELFSIYVCDFATESDETRAFMAEFPTDFPDWVRVVNELLAERHGGEMEIEFKGTEFYLNV